MDLCGKEHGAGGICSPADVFANAHENKAKNRSILKNPVNPV